MWIWLFVVHWSSELWPVFRNRQRCLYRLDGTAIKKCFTLDNSYHLFLFVASGQFFCSDLSPVELTCPGSRTSRQVVQEQSRTHAARTRGFELPHKRHCNEKRHQVNGGATACSEDVTPHLLRVKCSMNWPLISTGRVNVADTDKNLLFPPRHTCPQSLFYCYRLPAVKRDKKINKKKAANNTNVCPVCCLTHEWHLFKSDCSETFT